MSADDYLRLGTFVYEHQKRLKEAGLSIAPADSFGYFTKFDTRTPQWRSCPAGIASCGITSDGRVKGCLSMPDELTEGDLRDNDLWDVWFRDDAFPYNRGFGPRSLGENCSDCDMAHRCQGGCSAMSYATTGTFHNDPFCFYRLEGFAAGVPDRTPTTE